MDGGCDDVLTGRSGASRVGLGALGGLRQSVLDIGESCDDGNVTRQH